MFRPPAPFNEPVREYKAGSPERAELEARLQEMQSERMEIPCVIAGKDVRTGDDVRVGHAPSQGARSCRRPPGRRREVQAAIAAAAKAWTEWSRTPWEERVAVFLRASELLAGPWRQTINAATMLNQSKTVHQAEIDAACELIDFWRFNSDYLVRIYEEQPASSTGVWNRMEYRPLEGFVFAVSPFNFTAIGGNLTTSPAMMGNTVVWKPASTAAYSAYFLMRLLQEAGLPDGVINLVYGPGAVIGDAALASPDLAGIHFTGSTSVFQDMWRTVGGNIERYRSYPRIVGETGGKDFIVVHPSADADEVATAVLRGSFEYQGQKCSAASRIYVPESLWDETRDRIADEVSTIRMGDVTDFRNFMGAVIDANALRQHREAIEEAKAAGRKIVAGGTTDDSEGFFVEPTVIETLRSGRPPAPGGALRSHRDRIRLSRLEVARHLAARGRDVAVCVDGRGVRARSRRARGSRRGAAVRGGELLCQRQADRRGRRPAALWRREGIGHERQGGLDVEPHPLGQPADDQGDVRPGYRLPLPVPRALASLASERHEETLRPAHGLLTPPVYGGAHAHARPCSRLAFADRPRLPYGAST